MTKFFLWPTTVTTLLILTACTAKTTTEPPAPIISASPLPVEVVHTSRYTLVSLTPEKTLQYPLSQIASHSLPAPKKHHKAPTRGEALKIWLSGTGYSLCLPITGDMRQFFNSPLPESQRSPGPLRIETALQMIAGPAWVMNTDEITRTVCFSHAPALQNLS